MKFKKSQAAMEFIMTYGWALLVVLAAIGALAYFGVLSPDKFLPEKCIVPSGMACIDYAVNDNIVSIYIQNSMGYDLDNVSISIVNNGEICKFNDAIILINGKSRLYEITCINDIPIGKYKTPINITYNIKNSPLVHNKIGELIVKN